jgi:hypothetical protein
LVTPRLRDHEAQIRVDHPVLGFKVAALDSLRELDLLVGGQQRMAARLAKEQLERVQRDRVGLCLRPYFDVRVRAPSPTAWAVLGSRSGSSASTSLSCVGIGTLAADAALPINRIQRNSIVRIFDDDRIIRLDKVPVKRGPTAVTSPEMWLRKP